MGYQVRRKGNYGKPLWSKYRESACRVYGLAPRTDINSIESKVGRNVDDVCAYQSCRCHTRRKGGGGRDEQPWNETSTKCIRPRCYRANTVGNLWDGNKSLVGSPPPRPSKGRPTLKAGLRVMRSRFIRPRKSRTTLSTSLASLADSLKVWETRGTQAHDHCNCQWYCTTQKASATNGGRFPLRPYGLYVHFQHQLRDVVYTSADQRQLQPHKGIDIGRANTTST